LNLTPKIPVRWCAGCGSGSLTVNNGHRPHLARINTFFYSQEGGKKKIFLTFKTDRPSRVVRAMSNIFLLIRRNSVEIDEGDQWKTRLSFPRPKLVIRPCYSDGHGCYWKLKPSGSAAISSKGGHSHRNRNECPELVIRSTNSFRHQKSSCCETEPSVRFYHFHCG
jgi:hypothetical protein